MKKKNFRNTLYISLYFILYYYIFIYVQYNLILVSKQMGHSGHDADMGHEKIVFQGPIFLGLKQLELGGPLFTSGHFC